jgi:hypothetical protein
MADAGEAVDPAPRRLTAFGSLPAGWNATSSVETETLRDALNALALLYPPVELSPAEAKKAEKARKFLEKQKQKAASKGKDLPMVSVSECVCVCVCVCACAQAVIHDPLPP